MKFKLFPRSIKWEEVREEILKAMEAEERRNEATNIPSADESMPVERSKGEQESEGIRVGGSTAESGVMNVGGAE